MNNNAKIYIAGHKGMVGSAVYRKLESLGFNNIVVKSSKELDLTNQEMSKEFFASEQPEYVFMCAAKVGGIHANNTLRAEFIYNNLAIQNNVIHFSHVYGVKKLLLLGSSCIYPKLATKPIKEESLLSGYLEETNEPYAIAKIAGIKMCQAYHSQYGSNFISVMPTNLYGPNDNYDLETSHVLAALIRKFSDAVKNSDHSVKLWGTGAPRREFLHCDDLAEAIVFLMDTYDSPEIINIGCGKEISIFDLAQLISKLTGFQGEIVWDSTKPDGTLSKVMDVSRIEALGWSPKIDLEDGIQQEIRNFSKS